MIKCQSFTAKCSYEQRNCNKLDTHKGNTVSRYTGSLPHGNRQKLEQTNQPEQEPHRPKARRQVWHRSPTTWCQTSSIETLKEHISAPSCHWACGALLWQHRTIISEQRSMILQEVPKNVAIACGSKRVNGRVLTYTKEEPRDIWGAYFREWYIKDSSGKATDGKEQFLKPGGKTVLLLEGRRHRWLLSTLVWNKLLSNTQT